MLAAFILLTGRWSFARLDDTGEADPLLMQPRFWLVAALVALVLVDLCGRGGWKRWRLEWTDSWLMLFFAYLICSYAWAPDDELTTIKVAEVALEATAILALIAGRSTMDRQRVEGAFWSMLLVLGLVMAALAIGLTATGRVATPGGGPITFGRNMGLMAMAAWRLAESKSALHKIMAAQVIVLALLMAVMCGSRGALLSFAMGGATLALLARISLFQKTAALGVIVASTCFAFFFTETGSHAREVFQHRIVETTFQRQHMAGRDDLWATARELAAERPVFGWGLNGFRANSWHYPHNLFLEVTVEGGVIGLMLLLAAFAAWLLACRRYRDLVPSGAVAAFVLALTATQTSGDLYDSRCMFLLLVMTTPTLAQVWQAWHQRQQQYSAAWRRPLAQKP